MYSPTVTRSLPWRADLSLNWVIRPASPKPVRHSRTHASWVWPGTWLCTKAVHRSRVEAGGEQLRRRDEGALAQLVRRGRVQRQRVQVDDAVERVVILLQRHPLLTAPR